MKQRDRAREKLGDTISSLLIIVGTVGLVVYLLYLRDPSNVALRYALLILITVGVLLALVLAMLYLTRGVEHQGRIEQLRTWLDKFLSFPPRRSPSGIELKQ